MKGKLLFILICVVVLMTPGFVLARGTASGVIITNAKQGNADNQATLAGEVVGQFTNLSGYTNYSRATNVTKMTVTTGYDMNVINLPGNGSSGAGTYLDYTYIVTNWANASARITVKVLSNAVHPLWGASQYQLWTNYGASWGAVNITPVNKISNQLKLVAADSIIQFRIRVNIPGGAGDGSTNEYALSVWDQAWTGAAGDQWPGSGAIAPATADLADARDYQTDFVRSLATGPVIQLTKSVDFSSRKPYEVMTYTIKYTNTGSAPAYNITIDDVIYTNYARIIANSAETNYTAHSKTNYYWDGTTWQSASWDSGNENLVQRVRFVLRSPVNSAEGGRLKFSVRIE
ncbi:MAG: hypothetical protein PHF84_02295 [bacterium]|nr:hypothetical protein [bacterium]